MIVNWEIKPNLNVIWNYREIFLFKIKLNMEEFCIFWTRNIVLKQTIFINPIQHGMVTILLHILSKYYQKPRMAHLIQV